MSRQIIKKPDGKYAIWSTIVDDFIIDDTSKKELKNFLFVEMVKRHKKELNEILKHIDAGEPQKVYYQFAMTYDEAVKTRNEIHGEPELPELTKEDIDMVGKRCVHPKGGCNVKEEQK